MAGESDEIPKRHRWDVFISYATEDSEVANRVCAELKKAGWRPFLAVEHLNVRKGSFAWSRAIDETLDESASVLVLTSAAALDSAWVEYEWRSTNNEILAGRPGLLIPVCVEDPGPDELPRALRYHQVVDLRNWRTDLTPLSFVLELLRGYIHRELRRETVVREEPVPPPEASHTPRSHPPSTSSFPSGVGDERRSADIIVTRNGGVQLVPIPGGTFLMGSPVDEEERGESEGPQHEVTLSPFWMGKFAVTNHQFGQYLKANPGRGVPPGFEERLRQSPQHPVVYVDWHAAAAFAKWAGGRLPTEAEWEYAARAGTHTPYWFGKAITLEQANFASGGLVAVGSLRANGWGIHEMHGNVWEWTADWYGGYGADAQHDPLGPSTGDSRVLRGGSWSDSARFCRSAYRRWYVPGNRNDYLGFRLAADWGEHAK